MASYHPTFHLDQIIVSQASARPNKAAFIELDARLQEGNSVSFLDLHNSVEMVAAGLTEANLSDARVLLLYGPGLPFVIAFLGCLRAGVVAVPCPIARPGRNSWRRLLAIAVDCEATVVLTETTLVARVKEGLATDPKLSQLEVIATDGLKPTKSCDTLKRSSHQLAFLQYTSGSTGAPKGVQVSFENLIENARITQSAFGIDENAVVVCWLPSYHDLGLIGNILQTVYSGATCIILPPQTIIQNPINWLRAIDRYQATVSMAPNFAYGYCARQKHRLGDEALDLSSWKYAINAAEPIRAATLRAFEHAYCGSGFSPNSWVCAYGLAEATLVVSAGATSIRSAIRTFDRDELENGVLREAATGVELVTSGMPCEPNTVKIVDFSRSIECQIGQIGEIWVTGPSISSGYWQAEADTAASFCSTLEGDDRRFLRTGDLGAVINGELFVTGRIKEVLIVRGRKIYPQDIEYAVQSISPDLRLSGGAVFGLESEDGDQIVVVQEIERTSIRKVDLKELEKFVRARVSDIFEVGIKEVLFVRPETIPKTSSGKIQRRLCREMYLAGDLKTLGSLAHVSESIQSVSYVKPAHGFDATADAMTSAQRATAITQWLRDYAPRKINSLLMDSRRSMSPQIVLDFGNRGLMGLEIPAHLGGQGCSLVDTLSVIEQIGAIDLTLANFVTLQNGLGVWPVFRHGQSELVERVLPPAATGRELIAFAFTEPVAGSDPRSMRTNALKSGATWQLTGEKIWIGSAGWASHMNVFAAAIGDQGQAVGTVGFCVPTDTIGLKVGEEQLTMGLRSMVQNRVSFLDAPATDRLVLGDAKSGMSIAQEAMVRTRLYIGASALGGIKRAAMIMDRYASRRSLAGVRLGDFPESRRKLIHATAYARAIEALIACAATQPSPSADLCAVIKVVSTEALNQVLDDTCQILGGRGYIETNMIPQMIRDARILRIFEGPTEALLSYLGSRLLAGTCDLPDLIAKSFKDTSSASLLVKISGDGRERKTSDPSERAGIALEVGGLAAAIIAMAAEASISPRNDGTRAVLQQKVDSALDSIETYLGGRHPSFLTSIDEIGTLIDKNWRALCYREEVPMQEDFSLDPMLTQSSQELAEKPQSALREESDEPTEPIGSQVPSPSLMKAVRNLTDEWLLEKGLEKIASRSFAEIGVDSVGAVELAFHLEEHFEIELDQTILWLCPTVDDLSSYIAGMVLARNFDTEKERVVVSPSQGGW